MKRSALIPIFLLSALSAHSQDSIYDFTLLDIEGNEVSLRDFENKVILIVNVASKCGFTPQYEGLQALYERYQDNGLVILGFPANNFLWQESGDNEEIQSFCTLNYGVSFPMFSKISVKGRNIAPLYQYLTSSETNPEFSGAITWNFNKFLIDRQGNIVNRFDSAVEPLSDEVVTAIDSAL